MKTFNLHIDPSLYNFKWDGAQYVTVSYLIHEGNLLLHNIDVNVNVLGLIIVAGKYPAFYNDINAAARAHNQGNNNPVHPIIMGAIAHHITH